MKSIFGALTTLSLRFRALTLVLSLLILGLGVVAYTNLNQELLPPVELPQTIILAQAEGLTSDQALTLLTQRLEARLMQIDQIINLESTTSGAIGSVLIAYNNFGINQENLREDIESAIEEVWLPQRRILPQEGEEAQVFSARLLADLSPDNLLYLAENDPNFLFQLSPDVWNVLSDDSLNAALAYLASQVEQTTVGQNALERLVESEIVPQIDSLQDVANVVVTGGQALPGDANSLAASEETDGSAGSNSLLLKLSPEVWEVLTNRIDGLGVLDQSTVERLSQTTVVVPTTPPALPESWLIDNFRDAADLQEVVPLTSTLAGVWNRFYETGRIVGALGTTEDLTPETITQLIAIDPSLMQYLDGEQLAAMSPEVFAALQETFIAGLDGFTRDELAAAALAESVTGEAAVRLPVLLPSQWRIQQPQLITFSFSDLPIATFSVASTATESDVTPEEQAVDTNSPAETSPLAALLTPLLPEIANIFSGANTSESPVLGDAWNALASQPQFAETPLNTAADVIIIGDGQASQVLNAINENIPAQFEGYEVRLFDSLLPETLQYFAENEPDFYVNLDIDVLRKFSPAALAILPDDFLATLDAATGDELQAIANGEADSAFASLAAIYSSDIPEADPNAPALNPAWGQVGNFYSIELDTADDFFRFPESLSFSTASEFINGIFDNPQGAAFAPSLLGNISAEAVAYIVERDTDFLSTLRLEALILFPDAVQATFPTEVVERIQAGAIFIPTDQVTRTNGASSLLLTVYKTSDANTVSTYHEIEDIINEIDAQNDAIIVNVAFEQSSFVEESISGVAREGGLGAIFAIVVILVFLSGGSWSRSPRRTVGIILVAVFAVLLGLAVFANMNAAGNDLGTAFSQTDTVIRVMLILGILSGLLVLLWPGNLPNPSWRATIIIAISIPLSVMAALALMRWFSPFMHGLIAPLAENSGLFNFILQIFPESITLNIMTLSGLTVAVGRVVDDSIVVLENIFRQMQAGLNKRDAIITGTRDVSSAIFIATIVTVVVFLPLGLTGGIIGAFFLPFGLAVTFALLCSFIVAVTVVPALAYLFLRAEDAPEEQEMFVSRPYDRVLLWVLADWKHGLAVIGIAFVSFAFSGLLFAQRPFAFLPDFGEPQITVDVSMPGGTKMVDTNAKVEELEAYLESSVPDEVISAVQSTVGGGGQTLESLFGTNSIQENRAALTLGVQVSGETLDEWARTIRTEALRIFGEGNVTVSAGSATSGGFGGFSLVISGPQAELTRLDPIIIETLNNIEGITNAGSNLSDVAAAGGSSATTYLRVNEQSAVSYSAELETENTIGVIQEAIAAIESLPDLSEEIAISQGFQSELQTQGFQSLAVAIVIALAIVTLIMIVTFSSVVYWLAIILSVFVAPVGAAIALTLTNRVLGISALIGLLMLLGLVVTNAVVLIDRVRANYTERNMPLRESLIEAGERRLRPILMTSIATIFALIPLAVGLSEGAIIASELGTVVIGGMFSSTLLTLIVVPAAYLLLSPLHNAISRAVGAGKRNDSKSPAASGD